MLAKLLRNKRFDKKITQQEMADILEISPTAYRNKELEKNQFTLDEFKKIVATLNITHEEIEDIFFDKHMPKSKI